MFLRNKNGRLNPFQFIILSLIIIIGFCIVGVFIVDNFGLPDVKKLSPISENTITTPNQTSMNYTKNQTSMNYTNTSYKFYNWSNPLDTDYSNSNTTVIYYQQNTSYISNLTTHNGNVSGITPLYYDNTTNETLSNLIYKPPLYTVMGMGFYMYLILFIALIMFVKTTCNTRSMVIFTIFTGAFFYVLTGSLIFICIGILYWGSQKIISFRL